MKIIDLFKIIMGFILIIVGLVGGLIPIFQGWIFGMAGLLILSKYFKTAKTFLDWIKKKKVTSDGKQDDQN
tara:strand:- start:10117 stop:10329 length:213 start_codon:yes stop_codon:yes gene_type:complete